MKIRRVNNQGSALITVIMVMLVVMSFSAVVLTLVTSQTKTEVFYENNTSALHAAEAGINLYLWDLNEGSGDVIVLDSVISYPDTNPTAAFTLTKLEDTQSKKVVMSTGWMLADPTVTKSIKCTFTKKGFHQYVYFSNNDGSDISWITADNLYGPFHTNTFLLISGNPTFWGKVTHVQAIIKGPHDNPVYKKGTEQRTRMDYPDDNSELMSYAQAGDYYYEGRTGIRLNANGTITVWNLNKTPNIMTRPLPTNGVIYVNEKSGASSTNKFNENNGNVFISGTLDGRLTVAAKRDIYVTAYDPTKYNWNNRVLTNAEPSKYGLVYKDTTFSLDTTTGVVTVSEEPGKGDMLGLVAEKNVAVLTRGWYDQDDRNSAVSKMNIYAAIFAINNSFINSHQMDYSTSYPTTPGTLTVRGSIIQEERGAVSTHNNGVINAGYRKDYAHDPRMMYDQPPYFLESETTGWEIRDWYEIN